MSVVRDMKGKQGLQGRGEASGPEAGAGCPWGRQHGFQWQAAGVSAAPRGWGW